MKIFKYLARKHINTQERKKFTVFDFLLTTYYLGTNSEKIAGFLNEIKRIAQSKPEIFIFE